MVKMTADSVRTSICIIFVFLIGLTGLSHGESIHFIPLTGESNGAPLLVINETSGQEMVLDPDSIHIYFDKVYGDTEVKGIVNISCIITGKNITDAYMKVDSGLWKKIVPGPAPVLPYEESLRPNISGGPDFSLMFFLTCWLDTSEYPDGHHIIYLKAESSETGLSNITEMDMDFKNAPYEENPNSMWLWFGAGFIIGGGLVGTGGIWLKKHRMVKEDTVDSKHTKIS